MYRQLKTNPKCEIVACKPDRFWLRYCGKAVFETDPKYVEMALEQRPFLKSLYNEENGHKFMMFHLEDATCLIINPQSQIEEVLSE
ncbi:MAG: hypothetical protein IJH75_05085 [Mogibacterium sp.]|nr:hypothetical protein [Mogibacterium sp.]